MSCIPSQMDLAPGSPSPLHAIKAPRCATSRATILRVGTSLGSGFLFRMKAAFHSSVSNTRSAGKAASAQHRHMRRLMRQAITRYRASVVCSRLLLPSYSSSTRRPLGWSATPPNHGLGTRRGPDFRSHHAGDFHLAPGAVVQL